ncbi:HEAT repeat domain-containing protein, partial [Paraburkholderia sp. Ac-20347]|uniref:HEAT repeat domain-containing protein n=1 Tax=Paraburkholderia sp. Ac-20347 TaxID=2703892 RepID=UPI001981D905
MIDPTLTDLPPEAAAVLARLASEDATVRRIAVLDIGDLEAPELVGVLVGTLRDDAAPEVRREAATVLASWESEDVTEALCAALLDADDNVRDAAAQALSELKDATSAPALRRWAQRGEPFVRRAALR